MEIIEKVDYKHAEMLVDATLHSSLEDLIQIYKHNDMFETFDDRLICYLIAEAYHDGQTLGRSDDVVNALFFDEYHNGTSYDQERITKQAKAALHNLYKARFIRRDNQNNVYLCSEIITVKKDEYLKSRVKSQHGFVKLLKTVEIVAYIRNSRILFVILSGEA